MYKLLYFLVHLSSFFLLSSTFLILSISKCGILIVYYKMFHKVYLWRSQLWLSYIGIIAYIEHMAHIEEKGRSCSSLQHLSLDGPRKQRKFYSSFIVQLIIPGKNGHRTVAECSSTVCVAFRTLSHFAELLSRNVMICAHMSSVCYERNCYNNCSSFFSYSCLEARWSPIYQCSSRDDC